MCAAALACAATAIADAPLEPVTVCEILSDLPAHDGKDLAVFGRYSFRPAGRSISEQSCVPPGDAPPQFLLVEDPSAPRLPVDFEIDGAAVQRKFTGILKRTALGKFRFGTPDYDRWAVIYGRIQQRKGEEARKSPANLVIRGNGVIVYVTPD